MVLEKVTPLLPTPPRPGPRSSQVGQRLDFSNNLNSLIKCKMDQVVGQNGLSFIILALMGLRKRYCGRHNNTCF